MKKLEELGISPAPWKCATYDNGEVIGIENGRGFYVARFAVDVKPNDARLIAAAPELYDVCYRVQRWEDYAKAHNKAIEPWKDIMHDMRAALAKASGESEVWK